MAEILDIFDDEMHLIGTAPRDEVHTKGLLHQVVHCWILTYTGEKPTKENLRIWCQQRSFTKKDYAGLYDVLSMGGHIDAGEKPMPACRREIWEELGLTLEPEQLCELGPFRNREINIPGFHDRETAWVYTVLLPEPAGFAPGEEVEKMVWTTIDEMTKKELKQSFPVLVHTESGEDLETTEADWCPHCREFEVMVLPWLRSLGI